MNTALVRLKSLIVFAFHQVVGTWGIALLAKFSLFSLFEALPDSASWKPSAHFLQWVLTRNPFYPVEISAGLYFGWLLGRKFQHRSMLWIWVLPLAVLCYCLAATPPLVSPWSSIFVRPSTVQARLSFYFGWGSLRAGCIDQLLITMPFYTSVAYSLGALVARKTGKKALKNDSGIAEIALGPG